MGQENKMYHITRLNETTVVVKNDAGDIMCEIPADKDTPINMTGGIEFLIMRYK